MLCIFDSVQTSCVDLSQGFASPPSAQLLKAASRIVRNTGCSLPFLRKLVLGVDSPEERNAFKDIVGLSEQRVRDQYVLD